MSCPHGRPAEKRASFPTDPGWGFQRNRLRSTAYPDTTPAGPCLHRHRSPAAAATPKVRHPDRRSARDCCNAVPAASSPERSGRRTKTEGTHKGEHGKNSFGPANKKELLRHGVAAATAARQAIMMPKFLPRPATRTRNPRFVSARQPTGNSQQAGCA